MGIMGQHTLDEEYYALILDLKHRNVIDRYEKKTLLEFVKYKERVRLDSIKDIREKHSKTAARALARSKKFEQKYKTLKQEIDGLKDKSTHFDKREKSLLEEIEALRKELDQYGPQDEKHRHLKHIHRKVLMKLNAAVVDQENLASSERKLRTEFAHESKSRIIQFKELQEEVEILRNQITSHAKKALGKIHEQDAVLEAKIRGHEEYKRHTKELIAALREDNDRLKVLVPKLKEPTWWEKKKTKWSKWWEHQKEMNPFNNTGL